MTIMLRPTTPFDHPRIAAIWYASAACAQAPGLPDVDALLRRIAAMDGRGWQVTVAQYAGGPVVGFMALDLRHDDAQLPTLAEVFVSPDQIGTGVGRLLLDSAKTRMRAGFTLRTWAGNDRARAFYLKAGLTQTHQAPHPQSGHAMVYFRWDAV